MKTYDETSGGAKDYHMEPDSYAAKSRPMLTKVAKNSSGCVTKSRTMCSSISKRKHENSNKRRRDAYVNYQLDNPKENKDNKSMLGSSLAFVSESLQGVHYGDVSFSQTEAVAYVEN